MRRSFLLLAFLRHCPRTLAFLAEQLDVSARTVRRDLYTLEQAGIPLTTEKIPRKVARRGVTGDYIQSTTVWRVMRGTPCPICGRSSPMSAAVCHVELSATPPPVGEP